MSILAYKTVFYFQPRPIEPFFPSTKEKCWVPQSMNPFQRWKVILHEAWCDLPTKFQIQNCSLTTDNMFFECMTRCSIIFSIEPKFWRSSGQISFIVKPCISFGTLLINIFKWDNETIEHPSINVTINANNLLRNLVRMFLNVFNRAS